ncbi:hypothetical protein BDZ89DRAFT_985448 [Hymenopellis radicata]|nr:hypothetical protein BDZ89DRAFT_985448 [Hymenopellis radicata]
MDAHAKYNNIDLEHAMSFNDDYDEVGELMDLPSMGGGSGLGSLSGGGDKPIRRRSSKACDQCRKSKCKCERASPDEPCRSCVMLGTPCTFLGPSRKRGPPKGYIDAIEARLHQTEALLGIMISSADQRAQTLLQDLAQDPLAREIISRVDNSPYGVKGRKGNEEKASGSSKTRHLTADLSSNKSDDKVELASTHPSNEWQDRVTHMLDLLAARDTSARYGTDTPGATETSNQARAGRTLSSIMTTVPMNRAPSYQHADADPMSSRDGSNSPGRRLRRRIDNVEVPYPGHPSSAPPSATFPPGPGHSSLGYTSPPRHTKDQLGPSLRRTTSDFGQSSGSKRSVSPAGSCSSESDEEDLTGALGQLSLNEDEEVRYHGKASGLYLLHGKDRYDSRNEGGIWRFPKARVWPALQSGPSKQKSEDDYSSDGLPSLTTQEHLLDLYFAHVHPFFPVVHKQAFREAFRAGPESPANEGVSPRSSSASPFNRRPRRVPPVLLLVMFSIAARYSSDPAKPPPTDRSMMWEAGDDYLDQAKRHMESIHASSRPTTCQALLLMGYREIGIGAMAQAWTYIGMAIRMAQDLGMHRSADGWARQELGGRLFSEWELQTRRRIWYSCVVMDKYVSSYIGRPLSIFERDFDTLLPSVQDAEEHEEWTHHSLSRRDAHDLQPRPSRIISCFNASATLSGIISMIIQAIYAVRPVSSRHGESVFLEGILDKWFVELPEHLQHDPGSSKYPVPLPHVLTLHMQYWCAVLLLHRPFIRIGHKQPTDEQSRKSAQKSYELCVSAANHITSIATLYMENYPLNGGPVFLCYYIFTASIMHVASMSAYHGNPQASFRLSKCMEILGEMETIWPSASRARDLLQGAKVQYDATKSGLPAPERFKRTAEHPLNDTVMEDPPSRRGSQNFPMRTSNYTPSGAHASVFTPTGAVDIQYSAAGSSQSPATYFPSYDRQWQGENQSNYPVSTSGLPQVYSTGLNLDRRHSTHGSEHHPRYPQYWNDYSSYPPLAGGNAYPPAQPPVPQPNQDHLHSMFMPDQYHHVYNNSSSTQ